ncbi:MAG: hypothetical protein PHE79_06335 [Eubacteriales bacterium]|nr:hypothetical protein [Eubacteriales bacterium]
MTEKLNRFVGMMDGRGAELFSQDFNALKSLFGGSPKAEDIYTDILRMVFNSDTASEEPCLHIENIKRVSGEIGLKIGKYGEYFGVISIGNTAGLVKNCDKKGIVAKTEEFISESLFRNINNAASNIKVLVGSRKFTEGWNSWRVSTMGLINFAKGEGSQAIQLFGRGVRLRGYHGCLKRSHKLDDQTVTVPKHIELLETLTIFGIKAQYMEDFKKYLELEEMPPNEKPLEFTLPVVSRYDAVKDKKLRVIKVKSGANFKKQSKRLVLDTPDAGFMRYLIKNKITIDCRAKVQTIESSFSMQMVSVTEENTIEKEFIPYLDYDRVFDELQIYKNEKFYYNISIEKDRLKDILLVDGWYSLIIPKMHIKIDSFGKLEAATDYCIMALKSYTDKFFKYEKERWEAPLLEYQELTADDNNFIQEEKYSLFYTNLFDGDTGAEQVEKFVEELKVLLSKDKGIIDYEKSVFGKSLTAFDFRSHLYAPLICLKANGLKIQVSPVSLNEDEKLFVDRLKNYTESNQEVFDGKNLYLLRNKSKVGMGFFEAGNFYPDYVLWIDTPKVQYVSFIDPKGLMRVRKDDPKVEFYASIKDLEARLQPTSADKKIILNSFIMSGTKAADLKEWWQMTKPEREAKHVMCLDNDDCVDVMVSKILTPQYCPQIHP